MDSPTVANWAHSDATGPGVVTADGSPVELYRLLEPRGEPEIIQAALRPGSSILELGCGVGRITHPLLQMGFAVVAVDNSPNMLAFVEGAEKVAADMETLNLEREFDAVLLMSHFINVPDDSLREALLATCRRHLAPDGVTIIQRHDPGWLERAEVGYVGNSPGVGAYLDRVIRRGAEVDMTIRWEAGAATWRQSFTTRNLDEAEIDRALAAAGLRLDRWLDRRQTWLIACRQAV